MRLKILNTLLILVFAAGNFNCAREKRSGDWAGGGEGGDATGDVSKFQEGGKQTGGEGGNQDQNNVAKNDDIFDKLPPMVKLQAVPKSWGDCWLSVMVSATLAMAVKLNVKTGELGELATPVTKGKNEKERLFSIINPTITSQCRIDWLQGNTAPEEYPPGIVELVREEGNEMQDFEAGVACIAPVVPVCRCFGFTLWGTDTVKAGYCQERECTGAGCDWGKVHNAAEPDDIPRVDFAGCEDTIKNMRGVVQGTTWEDTGGFDGNGCRLDLEPLEPREEDKDWYGDEMRHQGVVTCENELAGQQHNVCRCYFLEGKPTHPSKEYGAAQSLCVKCKADGSCGIAPIPN